MPSEFIGLAEALEMTLGNIKPLSPVELPLDQAGGLVAARDHFSMVDAPSSHISLKDGFAIQAADSSRAAKENPVLLRVKGTLAAGGEGGLKVESGSACRILTGATMPPGADAVAAKEFCIDLGQQVRLDSPLHAGRNVLPQGSDVALGEPVALKGTRLTPGKIGLLTASGHAAARVHPKPRVSLMASGDEVILPGKELGPGKVYASNLLTLDAWCKKFGLETGLSLVPDDPQAIEQGMTRALAQGDALITIGGAWMGSRDWMARVLDSLGWQKHYHHVRIGPGKAVGFGLLGIKPVFVLPGGPPSNLMAFLQLGLPGLLRLAGWEDFPLPLVPVRLGAELRGQEDWTQFVYGALAQKDDEPVFHPLEMLSRLKRIAEAQAIAVIPEGKTRLEKGSVIKVQLLE